MGVRVKVVGYGLRVWVGVGVRCRGGSGEPRLGRAAGGLARQAEEG